jgi:uncharacterized protein
VRIHGKARQSLRLPCFWWGDATQNPIGVLPAFGEFTGGHPIKARPTDAVWAIAGETVRCITQAKSGPQRPS